MAADLAPRHKVRAEEGPFPTQDCTTWGVSEGPPARTETLLQAVGGQWAWGGVGHRVGCTARPRVVGGGSDKPIGWSQSNGRSSGPARGGRGGGLGAVGGVGPGWSWPGPPHTRQEVGGRGEPGPGAEARSLWANPHPLRGLDAQPRPDLRSCEGGREGLRLPAQHPGPTWPGAEDPGTRQEIRDLRPTCAQPGRPPPETRLQPPAGPVPTGL